LQTIDAVYLCACTRKEIADSALSGIEGQIYPGTCRNGIAAGRAGRAWRVRTNYRLYPSCIEMGVNTVEFDDKLQGHISQHLETEIGDFVIKRADGLFAYQLAVVADDAFQNITHVVRGCDLLTSTPRQIFLQRLLGLTTPAYMHLPVAVNAQGEKLSKQTLAAPVDISSISHTLLHALNFLNQATPTKLAACKPTEILGWAIAHWDKEKLKGIKQITVD
jgi:glutamyl-Q tRNA(Asp) synthetase